MMEELAVYLLLGAAIGGIAVLSVLYGESLEKRKEAERNANILSTQAAIDRQPDVDNPFARLRKDN